MAQTKTEYRIADSPPSPWLGSGSLLPRQPEPAPLTPDEETAAWWYYWEEEQAQREEDEPEA